MKQIILVLILVLTITPANALRLPHRKAPQLLTIKEEVLIEGKFANSETIKLNPTATLDLRIAMQIPPNQKYVTITTLYDEINENPIEQITWVIDNGKKKPVTRVKAEKIDQIINQKIESIALEYNPTLAYDRINDNKHIINKTFYYDQAAIFGDKAKERKLFLELYMPGAKGIKTKSIRVDEQIYQKITITPPPRQSTLSKKPTSTRPISQTIPNQANQANPNNVEAEVDADLQYARQQLNNFNTNTINTNNPATNNTNTNNPQMQQLQQMQQQMQLDAVDDEYGDFGEDEDAEEDEF